MKVINVTKSFILTEVSGIKHTFEQGIQEVEDWVADHWFTKAHSEPVDKKTAQAALDQTDEPSAGEPSAGDKEGQGEGGSGDEGEGASGQTAQAAQVSKSGSSGSKGQQSKSQSKKG